MSWSLRRERILFLPGAGGDGRFWKPVADRLPDDREKILLDWPGLGQVPATPGVSGLSDLVDLVLDQLREPVDLVAQSMGGVVAVQVAAKRPQAVSRLVLVATSGGIDTAPFRPEDWRPRYRQQFPESAHWITEVRVDLTDQIRKIQAPTLVLWGDADPIAPLALGLHLTRLLPSSELVIVKGGDHMFARLRAEEVAPHIARHLK